MARNPTAQFDDPCETGNDRRELATKPKEKPVVRVPPFHYQPSKAELEADVTVDASPEEIRDVLMRSVMV